MNLRTKTFLIIGLTFLAGIFVILLFSFTYLTTAYTNLEQQNMNKILNQGLKDISNEENRLLSLVVDWARWDETYYFVQDKNEDYITKNLNYDSLNNLKIDFILLLRDDNSIAKGAQINHSQKNLENFSDGNVNRILSIPGFLKFNSLQDFHSGYLILPEGPAMIASSPIITSTYQGPYDGFLVMGVILNPDRVDDFSEEANITGFISSRNEDYSLIEKTIQYKNNSLPVYQILSPTNGYLSFSTFIPTLDLNGSIKYSITRSTDILKQGRDTINIFIIILLILGIIIIIISLLSLDLLVLKRLNRIIYRIKSRYQDYKEEDYYYISGDDEFSELEKVIHPVILELNRSNEQLEEQIRCVTESENKYRELADSLSKLADIVEHTSSGIVTGTGVLVDYVNPAYARIHGMDQEELTEKNPFHVIKNNSNLQFLHYLQKGFHTGHVTFEMDHIRKDDTVFPALHELTVLSGEIPEQSFWIMNVHDITENRLAWKVLLDSESLRESARQLRDVISKLPDATFVIDKDGWVIFWNRAMEQLTGISEEEIIGRGMYEYSIPFYGVKRPMLLNMILEKDRNISDFYPNVEKTGDSLVSEESFPLMGKGGKYLSIIASPMFDSRGNIIGAIQSIRDITPRIMAEQALMTTNKKLNLLSSITRHDIRNRITVLLGLIPIIQQLSDDPADKEVLRIFSTAIHSIHDQIEFTRLYQDLGLQAPIWQDVEGIIRKASKIGIPKGVIVSFNLKGIKIFSDPLFERVFYNLIDNSLRHGGRDLSEISIKWMYHDDSLCLVYEDNGVGIPDEKKEIIFRRGYGSNTGFGLFLVREILSITGITIIETGKACHGARFEIFFPYGSYSIIDNKDDKI